MQQPLAIREGIYWIGVNDRETDLFEALWPLPRGISYNATLIVDEKVVLIDAVRAPFLPEFLAKIREALPEGRSPDYLVINHIEPDHAGALGVLLALFPALQILGNAKTLDLLAAFHGITDRTRTVADGEVLELGRRRLRTILTPMVHWPETMMMFEERDRLLFSGDVFGSYGAVDAGVSDGAADPGRLEEEARRYYATVLGRYSGMIRKALARVDAAAPTALLPSHGPLWERDPDRVRGWYDRWSRFEAEAGVVVAYASMYQHTKRMAESVAEGAAGVVSRVVLHDVARSHPASILADLWRFGAIALGTPTYNTALFPAMANLLHLLRGKLLKGRSLGLFSSHGWSGGAMEHLREFAAAVGWPVVEPMVEVRGAPGSDVLESCRRLGRALAEASRNPPPGGPMPSTRGGEIS